MEFTNVSGKSEKVELDESFHRVEVVVTTGGGVFGALVDKDDLEVIGSSREVGDGNGIDHSIRMKQKMG
jgi:hypothetical protein